MEWGVVAYYFRWWWGRARRSFEMVGTNRGAQQQQSAMKDTGGRKRGDEVSWLVVWWQLSLLLSRTHCVVAIVCSLLIILGLGHECERRAALLLSLLRHPGKGWNGPTPSYFYAVAAFFFCFFLSSFGLSKTFISCLPDSTLSPQRTTHQSLVSLLLFPRQSVGHIYLDLSSHPGLSYEY